MKEGTSIEAHLEDMKEITDKLAWLLLVHPYQMKTKL